MRRSAFLAVALAAAIGSATPAGAQLPDNYLTRWNDPAVQRRIEDGIERNRKSDVVLTLVDLDGLPVAGADVKITQKSHEFLFGCNIFVLGQMKEKNKAYEEAFLKLFNFATAAFYWDDLEPEQGTPRFAEGSSYILTSSCLRSAQKDNKSTTNMRGMRAVCADFDRLQYRETDVRRGTVQI